MDWITKEITSIPGRSKYWFLAKFPILDMTQHSLLIEGNKGAISLEICGERLWGWYWILAEFTNDNSYVKIHSHVHKLWNETNLRNKFAPVESQTPVPVAARAKA